MNSAIEYTVPIDDFVNALPKRTSLCVGVCTLSDAVYLLLDPIAKTWTRQTDRKSCVVKRQTLACQQIDPSDKEPKSVHWNWLTQSDPLSNGFSSSLAREVASLSQLRSEHGLVLIDLGNIHSATAMAASKLCDGLVLLLDQHDVDRLETSRQQKNVLGLIKSFQRPDCQWFGYWSLLPKTQAA